MSGIYYYRLEIYDVYQDPPVGVPCLEAFWGSCGVVQPGHPDRRVQVFNPFKSMVVERLETCLVLYFLGVMLIYSGHPH